MTRTGPTRRRCAGCTTRRGAWTACRSRSSSRGGNPFLLGELLGALHSDGVHPDARAAAHVSTLGPSAVSRAALVRIARLPGGAIELTRAVAVARGPAVP